MTSVPFSLHRIKMKWHPSPWLMFIDSFDPSLNHSPLLHPRRRGRRSSSRKRSTARRCVFFRRRLPTSSFSSGVCNHANGVMVSREDGGTAITVGLQSRRLPASSSCVNGERKSEVMDNEGPSSGDRPRTTWTIAMDRYLIDIMLEQVQKGFKHRSSFTRNAWEDMVTSINKKFGLQLDKEILQNRSKKFKQQYNAVQSLLQQNGFHWDETRQMVAADDNVWDDYLKVHPEAKSYRTRSVLNYNDISVIYGEESASQLVNIADVTTGISPSNKDPCVMRSSQVVEGFNKQAQGSSDRSRTTWTPTMDRYFIEIMMEQVHKGYKNNTIFRKKAWRNMVTLFNKKFGLGVEKDVLKNRLKKIRMRYYAIKSLLDHGGFRWDDTRQMVTADDHVWDDYIKVHPEARPYRTMTVPDYKNLSLIFGNENANGRYNSSRCSADLSNEIPEVKIGGESGGSQSPTISAAHGDQCESSQLVEVMDNQEITPSTDRSKTNWTPPMDRYFIEIMLEQVRQGYNTGNTFRKEAWAHMLELFNSKFGLQLDKETLRNRFRKLRMQYNAMKIILDHNGFCWDETRQMVVADDFVWDDYLKAHPEARLYRTKTVPNYNDLCVIYGNPNAGRRHRFSSPNMDFNNTSGTMIVASGDHVTDIQESSSHSGGGVDTSNQLGKRPSAEPLNSQDSRKTQRSTNEGMVDALRQMAVAVTSLANIKKENESCISCEHVVNALKAVPDVDEDLFLDACDLLEDEQKAKMFLALDVTIRKKWLMRKLRP